MSRPTNAIPNPANASRGFTIQGDTLYFAGIARTPFDDLRKLLSRGSGEVVRGGRRNKTWFQAQCAHYGLPTGHTLATLRLILENSLGCGNAYMEEKAGRVERDFRAAERRSRTLSVRQTERSSTPVARPVTPVAPSSGSAQPHEGAVPAITPQTRPQTPTHIRPQALQVVIPNAIRSPPLPYNTLPTPVSHPRVRTARRDQGSPTRNRSGSSTENAGHDPFVIPMPRATLPLDLPPLPHHSGPSQSQENRDQSSRLERDIVSGQWKVVVTSRTMKPPRSLSRVDASKWSRGEISIHLSQSRESLEAEFALFGLDGIIKSERFEISREGVRVTVEFVAQIPGATEYEEIKTLGPSRNRRGHLIFEAGKVRGMLSCPRYGKLEFEGVRIGVPRPMCASWSDWL